MSEGRALKESDLFDDSDCLDNVEQSWTVGGKQFMSKKDIRGNVVKREVGFGAKKKAKP